MIDPRIELEHGGLRETLYCHRCGSQHRFEALVSFAVNVVTSDGTVVRENYAEISGYRCCACGEDVVAPDSWLLSPRDGQ